jgi:hypothetical protein
MAQGPVRFAGPAPLLPARSAAEGAARPAVALGQGTAGPAPCGASPTVTSQRPLLWYPSVARIM